VSYVDAGYAAALGAVALYAVSLVLRRRRFQRALELSDSPVAEGDAVPERGGPS
jgi:hypothetical protein